MPRILYLDIFLVFSLFRLQYLIQILLYLQLPLCVFDSLHPEIDMTCKEDDSLIAVCKEDKNTISLPLWRFKPFCEDMHIE
jgi:hypothetical protein